MDVKAILKNERISPIKIRLMVDLIRGKDIEEALNILTNYNSKPARIVKKVVESAISNAVNNHELNREKLYIKSALVDQGSTHKKLVQQDLELELIKIGNQDGWLLKKILLNI